MLRLLGCLALAAAKTSPYSFSLSTFSPEGRIQQIEFAGKAVDNGPPCAAITTSDGVVLAKAYKKASDKALVVEGHSLHILRVTETTIATYAGLPADFRALVPVHNQFAALPDDIDATFARRRGIHSLVDLRTGWWTQRER